MEDTPLFMVLRPDDDYFTADLRAIAAFYESKYFQGVKPISEIEFVTELDGPACCFPKIDRIEVHEKLASYIKVSRLLVLHELINNKMFKIHSKRIEYDSEEFQKELKRLWEAGAYADLL